ncbi:hypothetical protein KGQ74_02075, partial [Patescibacteria group bacterium]|nr:hypothetical protein [Patescibacteria group bacterium]
MFANYQTAKNVLGNAAAIVLLAVASFGFAPAAHADYFATTTFNSTNSSTSSINLFVVPAGVTSITADLTAAGGAGAGGAYTFGGGAGGAGESFSQTIPVTPGQIIGYEVGAGGIGGTSGFINVNAGNGGIGGNTVFGTTTAFGGQGGKGAIYGDSSSGKGGVAGGIGATAGGNGDDQINANRTYGGTGGVSAVTGSVAGQGGYGDATTLTLPQAGKIGGGGGGASGWASANGTPQDTGANGGDGQIVLSYYVDNTAPTIT